MEGYIDGVMEARMGFVVEIREGTTGMKGSWKASVGAEADGVELVVAEEVEGGLIAGIAENVEGGCGRSIGSVSTIASCGMMRSPGDAGCNCCDGAAALFSSLSAMLSAVSVLSTRFDSSPVAGTAIGRNVAEAGIL
jgi:hypothetical protein